MANKKKPKLKKPSPGKTRIHNPVYSFLLFCENALNKKRQKRHDKRQMETNIMRLTRCQEFTSIQILFLNIAYGDIAARDKVTTA